MNTKNLTRNLTVVAAVSTLLGGCVAPLNAIRQSKTNVELNPSQRVALTTPIVAEEDGNVTVRGRVRRIGMGSVPTSGHVHVELIDASGDVVQSAKDKWFPAIPPNRPGRSLPNSASYAVAFPTMLPTNGVIRITVGNALCDK